MSQVKITKLVDFATTEYAKAFVLETTDISDTTNTTIYYGNVEKTNDIIDLNYNKGCLFKQIDNNISIYQGLYNAKDFFYKTVGYKHNTFDHKLKENNISNIIQINNYIYALKDSTKRGVSMLNNDIYTLLSANDCQATIDESIISTYTFNIDSIRNIIQNKLSYTDNDYLNIDATSPNYNLQYNQILETPGNRPVDYDSGYYPANIFKCKNNYDNLYNENYNIDNDNTIPGRQYISIDKCNNQIYLKYKNSGEQTENVETIVGLNRYETLDPHKTNMYNIDIACEKIFNNADLNDDTKEYKKILDLFKQEIKNCVAEICKKIAPADTQLINVNVQNRQIDFN